MNHGDLEVSPEVPRKAARDVWAPKLACIAVVVHTISSFVVAFWLYWIAPGYKKRLDDFGTELSSSAVFAISISDIFVNYWYVFPVFVAAALVVDYIATKWITRMLGLRCAILTVLIVSITILSHAIIGFVSLQSMILKRN